MILEGMWDSTLGSTLLARIGLKAVAPGTIWCVNPTGEALQASREGGCPSGPHSRGERKTPLNRKRDRRKASASPLRGFFIMRLMRLQRSRLKPPDAKPKFTTIRPALFSRNQSRREDGPSMRSTTSSETEIRARDLGLRGKAREDSIRAELAKPNGGQSR